MTKSKIVRPCEACSEKMSDKLMRWISLLEVSGKGTKLLVRNEMKEVLRRKIKEGGETI